VWRSIVLCGPTAWAPTLFARGANFQPLRNAKEPSDWPRVRPQTRKLTPVTARKSWRRGGRRFIQLWTNVKRSEAYYGLSVYARSALIELLDRYTGCNNGMIGLGCRELADALNCSRDRAAKALREQRFGDTSHRGRLAWQKSDRMASHLLSVRQNRGTTETELASSISVRLRGR
jgi:hypothetical protein